MCWLEHGMCSKIIKITSSVMPFPLLFSRQNSIIINTSFGIKMMNSKSPCSNIPNSTYATSQLMTGANGRPFISFTKTRISVGILMVGVVIVDSSFSFFLFKICHKVIESRHIPPIYTYNLHSVMALHSLH